MLYCADDELSRRPSLLKLNAVPARRVVMTSDTPTVLADRLVGLVLHIRCLPVQAAVALLALARCNHLLVLFALVAMAAEKVRTLHSVVLRQAGVPHRARLLVRVEEYVVVEVRQSDLGTVLRIATHGFSLGPASLEDGQIGLVVDLSDLALRGDYLVDQVGRQLASAIVVAAHNFHLDCRVMGEVEVGIGVFVPTGRINFSVALASEMVVL